MANNTQLELQIKNDINNLTFDEVYNEYGIIIYENKKVYDEVNERLYDNLNEWIYDYVNDAGVEFEKFSNNDWWDDEY